MTAFCFLNRMGSNSVATYSSSKSVNFQHTCSVSG